MTEIDDLAAYHATYAAALTPDPSGMAGWWATWHKAGVPAEDAAAWANMGYLPDEARPCIEAGITPEMAAAGDDALVAEHGGAGAAVARLQLEDPGATVLVDPDADSHI